MKPVFQAEGSEDCLRACIASLLEISLDDVCDIHPHENWVKDLNAWLLEHHGLVLFNVCFSRQIGEWSEDVLGSYAIGIVPSQNWPGRKHAVIIKDGAIVHDPLPNSTATSDQLESVDVLMRHFS